MKIISRYILREHLGPMLFAFVALKSLMNNQYVQVDGGTLAEVLANLESTHPGFKERLFDDDGSLRKFVNVFVADDDVRYLDGVDTKVPDGETVSIIPAVAGG